MSEAEGATIFQNLWQQAFGLTIALIIAIFTFWLFRQMREYVWKRSKYADSIIAKTLNENWGIIIMLGALAFVAYILSVTIFIF